MLLSSAIDKKDGIGFFTCSCFEGLLKVHYFEWYQSGEPEHEVIQEFGFDFVLPCLGLRSFWERFKMAWDILCGRYAHYLTLNVDDAIKLGGFLLDKAASPTEKKVVDRIMEKYREQRRIRNKDC